MSRLSYEKLNLQKYLKTPMISTKEAKLIYKYPTRMANVKTNFKFMHPLEDLNCPDCFIHLDTQKHLLDHAETFIDIRRYAKLFTPGDFEDKLLLVRNMEKILKLRE